SGGVPATTGTVNVSNPLTINQSITITTGTYNFGYNGTSAVAVNVTDPPGGTAFTLTSVTTGGTLTIWAGTTTFGGAASMDNSTFWIKAGATLIVGPLTISNGSTIIVDGTLIVNGTFTNSNNGGGTTTVAGSVQIFGNYTASVGAVALAGAGTLTTTGTITTTGVSSVFGSQNNCTQGPCSGTTLSCTFDNYITPSSVTVCPGVSTVTFTSNPVTSNPPSSPSYQWQSSTDNISFSNVGTNSSTYTTPTLTQTVYVKVTITATGPSCTSTSATSTVNVLTTGGWLGTTDDWGTDSNWCSGLAPNNTTDVIIANGTGVNNMPLIAAGTSAVCRNLIISSTNPASSVTLAASATASLNIFGDFTNNGTFTDNSTAAAAGVKFVGSVAQTVAGSTANVFNNLTFANTSGTTPAVNLTTNNVTVNSALTMSSGIINMNGFTITLGTAAGSTGTLNYTAGRFYGGNIERWFPTTSITVPAVAGQFPIGTSADYRPIYIGSSGLTASGGTIKIRHNASGGATAVTPTFTDNGGTVAIRSNSFWTVTTGNGITSTGTPFSIRTEGTGFGTVGNFNDLRITRVNTISPGSDGAHAGPLTNPQVNRTGISTALLPGDYYWGSINAVQTPLPIELLNFTAKLGNAAIDLHWKTASELNNDFFTVERMSEGDEKFNALSTIQGAGTKTTESSYEWIDKNPLLGISYYRLKQTDFDGKYTYSKVRVIENNSSFSTFKVYPNPIAENKFTLEMNQLSSNAEVPVVIINMQGAILYQATYRSDTGGNLKTTVEMNSVPSGVYMVVINAATGLRKKILIP
ncbi:MAG: T9SS type A sorting domain-containing protein, partial [Cyclobacteriaceae bacterium]|nr:T9SS type A sorting domain-containing protein [Cyclobacteriaceae bacterium]